MAIPTVNQLALSLMKEFGEDTSNSNLVSQVEAWIQDCYDEIGLGAEWKYLFEIETLATVASQRTYQLSGVLEQEIACQNVADNMALVKKTRQQLMELHLDINLLGKPVSWYVESFDSTNEKFTVGLYPVPDIIYNLRWLGLLQPIELTSTTKLFFPREFIFLLKDGVRIKFKEDDKDYTGASRISTRYNANLQKLKNRNDSGIAFKPRMAIMDLSSNYDVFVGLPPEHFTR